MLLSKPIELAIAGVVCPIIPQQSLTLLSKGPEALQLSDGFGLQQLCSAEVAVDVSGFWAQQQASLGAP